MNDNILSQISFDISFFLIKLENQVREKKLKFLLIRSDRELFDASKLEKYLTETTIQNTFILRGILQKAKRIIKINNEDFVELEILARDNSEHFGFSVPVGNGGFFTTSTPFECITIENNQIHYAINSEAGENYFFEQGNFVTFKSQDLAHKSARLVNLITAAFPRLQQNSIEKDLASIFNANTNAFEVCKELLNDLEITINGVPNTKIGRVGKLTGLIAAIKETPSMLILEKATNNLLLDYFNSHLNTSYKTFSKRNEEYTASRADALRFIKINLKK